MSGVPLPTIGCKCTTCEWRKLGPRMARYLLALAEEPFDEPGLPDSHEFEAIIMKLKER
jgi:hypothetical protein